MKQRSHFFRTNASSLLSSVILLLFVLIAAGSLDNFFWEAATVATSEILEDGRKKNTYITGDESGDSKAVKIFTGEQDPQGRWDGPVVIEKGLNHKLNGFYDRFEQTSIENVNMVAGVRDGQGITIFPNREDEIVCWDKGLRITCGKGSRNTKEDLSAYEILSYEYPWYIHSLYPFGFEDAYIEGYLDTLELLIFANDLSTGDFEDFYNEAIDSLAENTVYDTIITAHSILTILIGLDEIKNAEFRLAVIDQSRQDVSSTYEIISNKYTTYLEQMNDAEISDDDFEGFCDAFDSVMNTFPALDREDPFYVDSVENRLYYSLNILGEEESSDSSATLKSINRLLQFAESRNIRSANAIRNVLVERSDIAGEVFLSIFAHFMYGDKILEPMRKVYYSKESIVSPPVVTTGLENQLSPTSVELRGNIIEDGGGIVSASGMVWAAHYSPTLEDQTIPVGSGTGTFTVTLEDLTEGQTYFARTFATNEAGTAYGNNLEFTTKGSSGIPNPKRNGLDLKIYPNPTHSTASLAFSLDLPDEVSILIYDLKGSLVASPFKGHFSAGAHRIDFDVSHLKGAVYEIELVLGNSRVISRKLLIL